jgi:hypothetical protein
MSRDIRQECLNVIGRRIKREEDTLAHLRRTYPQGSENEQAIRLLLKYLSEVEHEILVGVPP